MGNLNEKCTTFRVYTKFKKRLNTETIEGLSFFTISNFLLLHSILSGNFPNEHYTGLSIPSFFIRDSRVEG